MSYFVQCTSSKTCKRDHKVAADCLHDHPHPKDESCRWACIYMNPRSNCRDLSFVRVYDEQPLKEQA